MYATLEVVELGAAEDVVELGQGSQEEVIEKFDIPTRVYEEFSDEV